MKWKQELPTEPGWYWLKEPREDARIVYVRMYVDQLAIGNSAIKGWPSLERSLWAGPIAEPTHATTN
jgi:hypothetical protein